MTTDTFFEDIETDEWDGTWPEEMDLFKNFEENPTINWPAMVLQLAEHDATFPEFHAQTASPKSPSHSPSTIPLHKLTVGKSGAQKLKKDSRKKMKRTLRLRSDNRSMDTNKKNAAQVHQKKSR